MVRIEFNSVPSIYNWKNWLFFFHPGYFTQVLLNTVCMTRSKWLKITWWLETGRYLRRWGKHCCWFPGSFWTFISMAQFKAFNAMKLLSGLVAPGMTSLLMNSKNWYIQCLTSTYLVIKIQKWTIYPKLALVFTSLWEEMAESNSCSKSWSVHWDKEVIGLDCSKYIFSWKRKENNVIEALSRRF